MGVQQEGDRLRRRHLDDELREKTVLEVKVQEGELKLTWVDDVWGSWKELVEAEDVQTLLKTASDVLKIAKELRAKGSGKGKRV